jgi:hypothetical protein
VDFSNPISVPVTVTSNNGSIHVVNKTSGFVYSDRNAPSGPANGNFAPDDWTLYNGPQFDGADSAVPLSIIFATPVRGAGTQINVNKYGEFQAKLRAFDIDENLVYDSGLISGETTNIPDNSALFIGVLSSDATIARIEFSSPTVSAFAEINDIVINRLDIVEPNPVAIAGPNQTVHCTGPDGAIVTLDGSASYDPDGRDDLDYEWSVAEGSGVVLEHPNQAVTAGAFPVGVHEVTLTVYDVDEFGVRKGGVGCDSVTIIVVDDEPPVARVTTDVASLWPANGAMLPVNILVEASDVCSAPAALRTVCTVSSSQPDVTNGATNRTGDVNGHDGYSAPVEVTLTNYGNGIYGALVYLRAERDASATTGRTYSISLLVLDAAGNTGEASTTVVVPHDGRGR